VTVTYSYAEPVGQIARQLIAKHHTHLTENGHVRIEYLFRSEAQETNGRTIWGKARKVTSINAFLAIPKDEAAADILEAPEIEPFFVIEIAADVWQTITAKQRVALVDHELSHCRIKFNKDCEAVLYVAPHDVEEFQGVIRRHGLYKSDVEHFAKIAVDALNEQMSLLDTETTVTLSHGGKSATTTVKGLQDVAESLKATSRRPRKPTT
jgi:predicted metallopeptidase